MLRKSKPPKGPDPKFAGKSCSFRYELAYDEIYDALRLIVDRRSPRSRRVMGIVLLVLAAPCVVLYALNPYGLQWALLAILFAVFSFLVLCSPSLRAKKGARAATRRKGYYKLTLSGDGYIVLANGNRIELDGDKDSRAYETDALFAIRPDQVTSVCLPKRMMQPAEITLTREILKTYVRAFHQRCGEKE